MTPSWYDVLDVEPTASTDEIRTAWRAAIAELEPGSRRFATLNQAAEVLLDEQRRAAYDAELAAQAPEPDPEPDTQTEPDAGPVADEPPTTPAATPAPPRVVPTWLLAVLGLLAALSVAAAVWVWQSGDDGSLEDQTAAAQSAAEQAIVPVLSYDYEDLDADRSRAESYLTSGYRESYDELFAVIEDNAPSTQTKVAAQVIASSIVRTGPDRVEVLVFVDQSTTNKVSAQPVVYRNQATVTMQKVGDDWLVDDLATSPAEK